GETGKLAAAPGSNGLGRVVAELYGLAKAGRLSGVKGMASKKGQLDFFECSKAAQWQLCFFHVFGKPPKTRGFTPLPVSWLHLNKRLFAAVHESAFGSLRHSKIADGLPLSVEEQSCGGNHRNAGFDPDRS